MEYKIERGVFAPCQLIAYTPTEFGNRPVRNFVCEGTHTHCNRIKNQLEGNIA